jgi:hypothetical protein
LYAFIGATTVVTGVVATLVWLFNKQKNYGEAMILFQKRLKSSAYATFQSLEKLYKKILPKKHS